MLLLREIREAIKAAKKLRLTRQAKFVWAGICVVIVGLFDHFGRMDIALPTLNSIGILGFLIALNWKLRAHAWFWATIVMLAAAHVLSILFVPWTTRWVPAIAIAAIDSADLVVMLTIIVIVGNFMRGNESR